MISMLRFPLHLAILQIVRPVLTLILSATNTFFFYCSVTSPGKRIFQLLKSITVTKVRMAQSLMCSGGKQSFQVN
jgi:hypothetical protein